MTQACLTQYFTPKRVRRSSSILLGDDSLSKSNKKLKLEDENNENVCSLLSSPATVLLSVTKKRRISPKKPTDGRLHGCDLDQIGKSPLVRRNLIDDGEDDKKVQRLAKVADVTELRKRLKAVRHHLAEAKEHQQTAAPPSETKFVPAHERFAHLLGETPSVIEPPTSPADVKKLASPADLRRSVQVAQTERLKKVLAKVDQSIIETLPTTPSKRIAGVNSRLLEQIRLKEEQRSQLNTLANTGIVASEEQRSVKFEMFNRLRESIDIIDQLFTTERQVALEWDRITNKLVELHSARFTLDQASTMLDFALKSLDECLPGYLIAMKLRNKQYAKMNRSKASMNLLSEYITKKLVEFDE